MRCHPTSHKWKKPVYKLATSERVGMRTWQLQEAKNHLNEVVRNAISDGPQNITLHGKPAAVVVSYAAFFQGNKAICQAFWLSCWSEP